MLMTSGQWDLNALEALEREALEVFDVMDVPEHIRPRTSPPPHQHQHHSHTYHQHHHHPNRPHSILTATANTDIMDIELESHIRNCPCNCNHMGYGNFMDYQVSLPETLIATRTTVELLQKQIQPPFRPRLDSERDLANFPPEFTDEEVVLTPDDERVISNIDQSEFDGFEYVNPLLMSLEDCV